jgi:hypothetical protein
MDDTAWSTALLESYFLWPLIEAMHTITIALFVGTIVMVDLRLLGVLFKNVPVSEMDKKILPWTVLGFATMIATGLLLFYAKPVVYYHSIFFRVKMLMLVVALINIVIFHFRVQRDLDKWDTAPAPPLSARISAVTSLSLWIGIVMTGRMIAYDWFNCDKLAPGDLLYFLTSCRALEVVSVGGL